jgi:hypothetical protein
MHIPRRLYHLLTEPQSEEPMHLMLEQLPMIPATEQPPQRATCTAVKETALPVAV